MNTYIFIEIVILEKAKQSGQHLSAISSPPPMSKFKQISICTEQRFCFNIVNCSGRLKFSISSSEKANLYILSLKICLNIWISSEQPGKYLLWYEASLQFWKHQLPQIYFFPLKKFLANSNPKLCRFCWFTLLPQSHTHF